MTDSHTGINMTQNFLIPNVGKKGYYFKLKSVTMY